MKLPRLPLTALLLACFLGLTVARADDLTTLSGTTYRGVVPVRVEPDGVTWRHVTGIAKVDFADSPEGVRRAYHYDAAKAVVYHAAQEQARTAAEAQTHQILQTAEARRHARVQAAAASGAASADGNTFSYRPGGSMEVTLAERVLGEQIAALKDTSASARAVNDYRSSPYQVRSAGTQHAWDDGAFQPNYLVKGYNDDVDRSTALLRNAGF